MTGAGAADGDAPPAVVWPYGMTTLVLGPPPPELEALLERRRQAGVDTGSMIDEEDPPATLVVDPADDPARAGRERHRTTRPRRRSVEGGV
jgi:hypothetical protein